MKRLIASLLLLGMMTAAFASCTPAVSTSDDATPSGEQSPSTEASTPEETPTPTPTPTPSEEPVTPADPAEVLKGKKALFLGDSIVAASGYKFYGWPGRIKTDYGMLAGKNCGVDGASLSNVRGDNLVVNHMLNNYKNDKTKYDFVVLEGGVNDAWDFYPTGGRPACPIGEVSPGTAEETDISALDRTTMAGGMEHLISEAKRLYPDATIIFVFNFKLRAGGPGKCGDMDEHIAVQKQICDKWGIPYCNLYENKELNAALKVRYSSNNIACVPDGIHPNDRGYDLIAPVIAQFMADTYVKTH